MVYSLAHCNSGCDMDSCGLAVTVAGPHLENFIHCVALGFTWDSWHHVQNVLHVSMYRPHSSSTFQKVIETTKYLLLMLCNKFRIAPTCNCVRLFMQGKMAGCLLGCMFLIILKDKINGLTFRASSCIFTYR
jgi:hypothetical protein